LFAHAQAITKGINLKNEAVASGKATQSGRLALVRGRSRAVAGALPRCCAALLRVEGTRQERLRFLAATSSLLPP
jgi:hypothetical protein